jgi:hypothetical protein
LTCGAAPYVAGQIDEYSVAVIIPLFDMDIPFCASQFILQVFPLLYSHAVRKGDHAIFYSLIYIVKELSPEYSHD